jgi:hypothetical protein
LQIRAVSGLLFAIDEAIRAISETPKPFEERSFRIVASFQISRGVSQTHFFAEASPKFKNPRSKCLRRFLKRSALLFFDCRDVAAGQGRGL